MSDEIRIEVAVIGGGLVRTKIEEAKMCGVKLVLDKLKISPVSD